MDSSTERKCSPDIICDNSVWYRLGDGRISRKSVADMRLVSTFTNINELCTSQNLIRNQEGYNLVWGALLAIHFYSAETWAHTPYELLKFRSGYDTEATSWEVIEEIAYKVLLNPRPDEDTKVMFQHFVTERKSLSSGLAKLFMDDVYNYHKSMSSRGALKKQLKRPEIQAAYLSMCQQALETNLTDGSPIQWNRFELFICTLNRWFYELSVQNGLSMTNNDWVDIHNLIYVAPGDLYWTEDNLKTKEFIKQAGCGHYLYQHHTTVNG